MTEKQISVVIVDDHPGVRKGIKNLLKVDKGIKVVGEASDGKEALQVVHKKEPDILLLDIELPIMRGDEVIEHVRTTQPEVRVLVISSFYDRVYVQGMLNKGAVGYITKDEAPEMLLRAIHRIVEEETTWVSPSAAKYINNIWANEPTLTRREIEIFKQLLMGRSDKEISKNLGISEQRLQNYLHILMSKFDAEDHVALKRVARKLLADTHN